MKEALGNEVKIDEELPACLDCRMSRIRKTTLLHGLLWALLLLSGLAVRCIGIRHGEADRMVYHPDVAKQSLVARFAINHPPHIRKIFHDDFRKTLYPYGSAILLSRTVHTLSMLTGKTQFLFSHRYYWALWLRYLSVISILLGTGVLIGVLRRHLGGAVAALAGILLLFEPINVQLSHYGMNDVPLLAFLFLTIAAALQMPRERSLPLFSLLAGLAAGIGFAIKYQGILALIFPGIFWLYLVRDKGPRWAIASLVAVGVGFLAGSLPLSPLLVHDPAYFFSTFPTFMNWQTHIMGEAIPMGLKLRTNLTAMMDISLQQGHFLLWGGGLWAGIHAFRHRREPEIAAPIFSILLFCGLLLLAMLFSRDLVRVNDLMPVFALFIVAAAFPAAEYLTSPHPAGRRMPLLIPASMLALLFLLVSLQDSLALRHPDTRIRARQWCDEHLPPDSVVASEMYTLPPTRPDLTVHKIRYLSDPLVQSALQQQQVDVLLTSSLASSRYANHGSPFYSLEAQASYQALFSQYVPVATFSDRPLYHAHPKILVYQWANPSP